MNDIDRCTGCGKHYQFLRGRLSPAIATNAVLERLCDDCVILWDAVAMKSFFIEAQREWIAENVARAKHKIQLLGDSSGERV